MLEIKCPLCYGDLLKLTLDEEFDISTYKCDTCGEYYDEVDVMEMANGQYWTWQYWYNLACKYEHEDFSDGEIRNKFRKEFERLSVIWFNKNFENYKDFAKDLSEMWCGLMNDREWPEDVIHAYKQARGYLEYASDRMYINRWLYVRLLLNYDVR